MLESFKVLLEFAYNNFPPDLGVQVLNLQTAYRPIASCYPVRRSFGAHTRELHAEVA